MSDKTEAYGTMECPICGFDRPHTHDREDVEWYRTGRKPGFQESPPNDNQKRQLYLIAKAQYGAKERQAAFNANPRQFIKTGMTLYEQAAWIDPLLEKFEQGQEQIAFLAAQVEQQQAQIATLTAQLAEAESERNALRTCPMIVCPYEADLKALRAALSALETMAKDWRESAERLRAGKGQMTREKRGHEVLASCGAILGEMVATLLRETGA